MAGQRGAECTRKCRARVQCKSRSKLEVRAQTIMEFKPSQGCLASKASCRHASRLCLTHTASTDPPSTWPQPTRHQPKISTVSQGTVLGIIVLLCHPPQKHCAFAPNTPALTHCRASRPPHAAQTSQSCANSRHIFQRSALHSQPRRDGQRGPSHPARQGQPHRCACLGPQGGGRGAGNSCEQCKDHSIRHRRCLAGGLGVASCSGLDPMHVGHPPWHAFVGVQAAWSCTGDTAPAWSAWHLQQQA